MGLYDGVMVKDNHLLAKPELQKAILSIRRIHPDVFIEVEADSIDQVRDFVNLGGIDVILLDNMSTDQLRACVSLRDQASNLKPVEVFPLRTFARSPRPASILSRSVN